MCAAGCLQDELFTLLENEDLAKVPIIVLANKQDMKDAMGVEEMTQALSLHSIRNHDWHIQVGRGPAAQQLYSVTGTATVQCNWHSSRTV
eukprot:365651-Chlamydomonas_euryale.AAC.1